MGRGGSSRRPPSPSSALRAPLLGWGYKIGFLSHYSPVWALGVRCAGPACLRLGTLGFGMGWGMMWGAERGEGWRSQRISQLSKILLAFGEAL